MNTKQYTYQVLWSEEDAEFVGLCAEFPSLSWLDKDQEGAFYGIVNLVAQTVADMKSNSEPVPMPLRSPVPRPSSRFCMESRA